MGDGKTTTEPNDTAAKDWTHVGARKHKGAAEPLKQKDEWQAHP